MKKALKLILVEVSTKPKEVVDKSSGETLHKFRHTFMTEQGTELIAFSDNDGYRSRVTPALSWNPDLATEFLFNSTMWDNKEQLRLVERTQADAFMRSLKK